MNISGPELWLDDSWNDSSQMWMQELALLLRQLEQDIYLKEECVQNGAHASQWYFATFSLKLESSSYMDMCEQDFCFVFLISPWKIKKNMALEQHQCE